MSEELNISLINGTFTRSQAKEILSNMIGTKIQFHQLKNFSSIERTGHPDVYSESKLPQLRSDLKLLHEFLSSSEDDTETISIKSEITLSRKKHSPTES
jgi:hypothetical protein